MPTTLLPFFLLFHSGWSVEQVEKEIGADRCKLDKAKHVLTCNIGLAPFSSCTFKFEQDKLYSIKVKTARPGDWSVMEGLYAETAKAAAGLTLHQVSSTKPFAIGDARARLENKGSAKFGAAVMVLAEHDQGRVIGELAGFKTSQDAQAYAVELTWLPAGSEK